MTTMLSLKIGDPHVWVDSGDREACAPTPGILELLTDAEHPRVEDSRDIYRKLSQNIVKEDYLKDTRRIGGHRGDSEYVWGFAAEGIGYFSADDMIPWGYRSLTYNVKRTRRIMDKVNADLEGANGIIVDIRWNDGGWDALALEIASYFTNKHQKAFTKQVRDGDGFSDPQDIWLPDNSAKGFGGPVALLCGNDTLSAPEIFALAMYAMPNVTSIGMKTCGALSDELFLRMPNGWKASLSNELYTAVAGSVFEGSGIPVDIPIDFNENNVTIEEYIKLGMHEAIAFLQQ